MSNELPQMPEKTAPEKVVDLLKQRLANRGVLEKVAINFEVDERSGYWEVQLEELWAKEMREKPVMMTREEAEKDADIVLRPSTIIYDPEQSAGNRLLVTMSSAERMEPANIDSDDGVLLAGMVGGTVDMQYIGDPSDIESDIETAVSRAIEWTCDGWSAVSDNAKKFFLQGDVKFAKKL
jgi:hypothetical protein